MDEYTVRESERNLNICINILAGEGVMLVRNVNIMLFTSDGTATGESKSLSLE